MTNKVQSDAIAQIALSLSDKPIPTAAEILAALNKAYEVGYVQGTAMSDAEARRMVRSILAMGTP